MARRSLGRSCIRPYNGGMYATTKHLAGPVQPIFRAPCIDIPEPIYILAISPRACHKPAAPVPVRQNYPDLHPTAWFARWPCAGVKDHVTWAMGYYCSSDCQLRQLQPALRWSLENAWGRYRCNICIVLGQFSRIGSLSQLQHSDIQWLTDMHIISA